VRLIHYSKAPLTFNREHRYNGAGYAKPEGFWVSVEGKDDWKSWCESESWGDLSHPNFVTLARGAKVLRIKTLDQFETFEATYLETADCQREARPSWAAVKANGYAGIIIAPYQWERRLDRLWYYGWDCASGVIWDLSAIESVVPMTHVLKAAPDTEVSDA
jgi:hypothetical protein